MRLFEIALAVLAAFLLQTVVGNYLPPVRHYLDSFLIVVTALGLVRGRLAGLVSGSAAGLVQDTFSSAVLGLNGFSKTTVGYLAGIAGRRLILRGWPARLLVFIVATATDLFVLSIVGHAIERPAVIGEGMTPLYLCLGNGIVGVLALGALERFKGGDRPDSL